MAIIEEAQAKHVEDIIVVFYRVKVEQNDDIETIMDSMNTRLKTLIGTKPTSIK